MKQRRQTASKRTRNKAPKAARARSPSAAELQRQLTQRTRELAQTRKHLADSLEQQTATSEVLSSISSAKGELAPVFEAMLGKAVRICEAKFGILNLWDGDAFRLGALHNLPPAFAEFVRRGPLRPGPDVPLGRAGRTKQVVHCVDITQEPFYLEQRDPVAVAGAELGGYRTVLAVPMVSEEELVGAIVIFRQEVRPFTHEQIGLVSHFAKQAVIAIENARLLNELRERTDDLSESLNQQTAMADVLRVMSGSAGDLEPVFKVILENATGICGAKFGTLYLYDMETHFTPPPFIMPHLHSSKLAKAALFARPLIAVRAARRRQNRRLRFSIAGDANLTSRAIRLWLAARISVDIEQSSRCRC